MNKNKTKKLRKNITFLFFFTISLIQIILYFYFCPEGIDANLKSEFLDFHARWCEGRYFLQHINPNLVVLNQIPVIHSIGYPGESMTTIPISYVLGQFIVPSFLPYYISFLWMIILLIFTTYFSWKIILNYIPLNKKEWVPIFILLTFSVWNMVGWTWGNYGMILCNLVIISMYYVDRKPWLAGVLLAIASCKPQLTMMFFFALLFSKKWKSMFIGGTIAVTSFFSACLWLNTSPFEILDQMSKIGEKFITPFRLIHSLGIANNLMYYTKSQGITQLVSAIICIIIMAIMELYFYKNKVQDNIVLQWSLAGLLSTICAYKHFQDMYVMIIFLVLFYSVCNKKETAYFLMTLFSNRFILMLVEVIIRIIVGEKNYWLQIQPAMVLLSLCLLYRIVKNNNIDVIKNNTLEFKMIKNKQIA